MRDLEDVRFVDVTLDRRAGDGGVREAAAPRLPERGARPALRARASTPTASPSAFVEAPPDRLDVRRRDRPRRAVRRAPDRPRGPPRDVPRRRSGARPAALTRVPAVTPSGTAAPTARAAEALAALHLRDARPRDRRAQRAFAATARSTSSRATAPRSCSSRCACGGRAATAAPPPASRRRSARASSPRRASTWPRLPRTPPCRFDVVLLDALDRARIEWLRDAIDVSGDVGG